MTDGMAATKGKGETMMAAQPDDGLMPCPFCGGGHAIVDRYDRHDGEWRYRVICADCMARVDSGWWQRRHQAVEAWNRRAGRTCHIVSGDRHNHAPHCDLCGAVVQDALPSFCPHCGARVVSGDG